MIRIVSWNILHGGGSRIDGIVAALSALEPDILTLQEVRRGKGEAPLVAGIEAAGLSHVYLPETADARENTILVAAREPFTAARWPDESGLCHILRAGIGGIDLYALHFPQKKAQLPLFHALLDLPVSGEALLLGDMNCGIPFEDSDTKTFQNTHLFQQLLQRGWVDAWRSRNPDAREYSWISAKRRNGFRYDQALATPELDACITGARYAHDLRESGLSDHSAMILELDR